VREVRGAHIEMSSTPGEDYPAGTVDQPDEAPLALRPGVLDRVLSALDELRGEPGERIVRKRFILVLDR
jgi:hypothetical protein